MSNGDLCVGVGDSKASGPSGGRIVTHALGSCLAVTLYDPATRVGAMLHAMLPGPAQPGESVQRAEVYLTSGLPALQRDFEAHGGRMSRAVLCAAGAAELLSDAAGFRIGARNWAGLRKLCFKQGITIAASDVGGGLTRNMSLDLATGEVAVTSGGTRKVIWRGANEPRRQVS